MKWRKLLMAAGMISLLAACSDDTTESDSGTANEGGSEEVAEVEANDEIVEITLPQEYFDDMSEETLSNFAQGYEIELKDFSDSEAVFSMTQARLDEIITDYPMVMEAKLSAFVDMPEMSAVTGAKASDDYKKFEYVVDPEILVNSEEQTKELVSLYEVSTFYHAFKGEILPKITFEMTNSETNEVYQTMVLPDDATE